MNWKNATSSARWNSVQRTTWRDLLSSRNRLTSSDFKPSRSSTGSWSNWLCPLNRPYLYWLVSCIFANGNSRLIISIGRQAFRGVWALHWSVATGVSLVANVHIAIVSRDWSRRLRRFELLQKQIDHYLCDSALDLKRVGHPRPNLPFYFEGFVSDVQACGALCLNLPCPHCPSPSQTAQ